MYTEPAQITLSPLIDEGAALGGGVIVINLLVELVDAPHPLFAFTLMVPEVVFDVMPIVFVVELPDQPTGKVHV